MTAREFYEGSLFELNSIEAPEIYPDEWNYFAMKGVYSYIHDTYKYLGVNEQNEDDSQVLKARRVYTGTEIKYAGTEGSSGVVVVASLGGITKKESLYNVNLPAEYFHITKCLVFY